MEEIAAVKSGAELAKTSFGVPLTAIELLNKGVDVADKIRNKYFGSINLVLTNYAEWPISDIEYNLYKGKLEDSDDLVPPASRLVIGGFQNSDISGTEAIVFFNSAPNVECFIYWRVWQEIAGRPKNALGLGCYLEGDKETTTKIQHYLRSPKSATDLPVDYNVYDEVLPITRYCGSKSMPLCIRGSMKSDNKQTVRVSVIPKMVKDVATNLTRYITQEELDGATKRAI